MKPESSHLSPIMGISTCLHTFYFRKDLLAAADSSIQFSLLQNRDMFADEINGVTVQFEEEEKAEAEAKKIELAEKALQDSQEQENAAEVEEDIPPPPPPPPPPVPAPVPRQPNVPTVVSENDTALLIQESVFQEDVFSSSNQNADSPSMNITNLLANVQSSDFALHHAAISPSPELEHSEPVNIPSFKERELSREISESPKATSSDTIVIMSKQFVAKEIYEYETEDKQFTHYSKETTHDPIKPAPYLEHEILDIKLPERYHDYPPDYKKLPSSYKPRKHIDEYRERSSGSKHGRERSLSPRSRERYKEYSARDYGHNMDRLFKSPEYYMSLSRSSSGRSSSKEASSRDRRKREEEWYARHPHSSKHSHSLQKGTELPRRGDYYRDFYDKKRYEDPHYKSSSERSKSREYSMYESSRSTPHDPYKIRESSYDISKVKESKEFSKFKDPGHNPSKYYDQEYEVRKKKDRGQMSHSKMKEDPFKLNEDRWVTSERTIMPDEFEKVKTADSKSKQMKESITSTSPQDPPPPVGFEKPITPLSKEFGSPEKNPDNEPSTSRYDHEELVNRAISKIPKTPDKQSPNDLAMESDLVDTKIKEDRSSEIYLQSPKNVTNSPEKMLCTMDSFSYFESHALNNTDNCNKSKKALIDSILPRPKYCSILKETFAVEDDLSAKHLIKNDEVSAEPQTQSQEEFKNTMNNAETGDKFSELKKLDVKSSEDHQGMSFGKQTPIEEQLTTGIKNKNMQNQVINTESVQEETYTGMIFSKNEQSKKIPNLNILDNQDFPLPASITPIPFTPIAQIPQTPPQTPPLKFISIEILKKDECNSISHSVIQSTENPDDAIHSQTAEHELNKGMRQLGKAAVAEPIKSTPVATRNHHLLDDAEEGEILSDTEEKIAYPESIIESNDIIESVHELIANQDGNEKELKAKENEAITEVSSSSIAVSQLLIPKAFVPEESFPIRSKRDFFKARFFQPDMKIDFAKPEQIKDLPIDSTGLSDDREKAVIPPSHETKPNPDEMRYSRKMRFKEVLQQHINEQEMKESKQKDIKEATGDSEADTVTDVHKESAKEAIAPSQLEITSPNVVKSPIPTSPQVTASFNTTISPNMTTLQQPIQSTPVNADLDVSAVSLIGKRKRFLNDYIASLESNPPPTKSLKTEDTISEETLPKLRIKPLSGGSYCAETLSSTSSAPPPLHKASTTSPDKEIVPKCIIKLGGKGNWSTCESEKQEKTVKRKNRSGARENLRSREASNDSNKSGTPEKPRLTRSKNTSKKSVKSYDVDDDDKNSDNSFEETDKSRKSGRTRKTIKRLNL